MSQNSFIDIEPQAFQGRKGDGGTYLVVADDTDEFRNALIYAAHTARNYRARLGILHIIENQDFQHWGSIEGRMKKEMRENAEKYLWAVAKAAQDFNGTIPSLYIAEGEAGDTVVETINNDKNIVKLILGGGKDHAPGPLVSFFTSKGLSRLNVPVVIVPGHIKEFS